MGFSVELPISYYAGSRKSATMLPAKRYINSKRSLISLQVGRGRGCLGGLDIHEFEEYIDVLPEYLKYSLLDFRTDSQKLPVNCRSKLSIPRQERICTKCRKRFLGDEYHFPCECNGIEKLRITVIPKYHTTRCSTLEMTQLLHTNDRESLMTHITFMVVYCVYIYIYIYIYIYNIYIYI